MDRRTLLAGLGCSLAASPWLTPVAMADAPGENRLVVIVLRGAMDGLDAIQPVFDPDYASLRPTLSGGGLPIGDWALHPALAPLLPLWRAGEMGAVHAVSTPYRDKRSHFDGQDILEAGLPALEGSAVRDGWLNRLLSVMPAMSAEGAYSVGRERMLVLDGAAPVSRWSPEVRLRVSPQAERLLQLVFEGDPLFEQASDDALRIAGEVDRVTGGPEHMRIAEFAVARLRESTRIASFSLGGWDTHGNQAGHMRRTLGRLSEMITTLRDGLGPVWEKTGVICLTEFGRTARENGTAGTDHGTGGAMLYFGGALNGGRVLGRWPGLNDLYEDRDLMPVRDVRAYAGWALRGLFGTPISELEQGVFPGLDMGSDPGLI